MTVSGYHQVVYAYDAKGNIISESYYDAQGMRTLSGNKRELARQFLFAASRIVLLMSVPLVISLI